MATRSRAAGSVLHLWPDAAFDAPTGANFDHAARRLEESIAAVKATFEEAGVDVETEFEPLGATGRLPQCTSRTPSATASS